MQMPAVSVSGVTKTVGSHCRLQFNAAGDLLLVGKYSGGQRSLAGLCSFCARSIASCLSRGAAGQFSLLLAAPLEFALRRKSVAVPCGAGFARDRWQPVVRCKRSRMNIGAPRGIDCRAGTGDRVWCFDSDES